MKAGITRMSRDAVDALSDDELTALSDAEIDALVASQDTITRLNDEAGLYRMTGDYRAYRTRCHLDGVWAQFRMMERVVMERPITAPADNSRPWERREAWKDTRQGFTRYDLAAPDWSLLDDSPERISTRWED